MNDNELESLIPPVAELLGQPATRETVLREELDAIGALIRGAADELLARGQLQWGLQSGTSQEHIESVVKALEQQGYAVIKDTYDHMNMTILEITIPREFLKHYGPKHYGKEGESE